MFRQSIDIHGDFEYGLFLLFFNEVLGIKYVHGHHIFRLMFELRVKIHVYRGYGGWPLTGTKNGGEPILRPPWSITGAGLSVLI